MRQAFHQEGVEPALLHRGMPQQGGPRAVEAAHSQAARGAQGEAATRVGSVPWPRLPEHLPQDSRTAGSTAPGSAGATRPTTCASVRPPRSKPAVAASGRSPLSDVTRRTAPTSAPGRRSTSGVPNNDHITVSARPSSAVSAVPSTSRRRRPTSTVQRNAPTGRSSNSARRGPRHLRGESRTVERKRSGDKRTRATATGSRSFFGSWPRRRSLGVPASTVVSCSCHTSAYRRRARRRAATSFATPGGQRR